jgi:hypothetical protein
LTAQPSFRDGPKDQTRNLEIPGSRQEARPGMTVFFVSSLPGLTRQSIFLKDSFFAMDARVKPAHDVRDSGFALRRAPE